MTRTTTCSWFIATRHAQHHAKSAGGDTDLRRVAAEARQRADGLGPAAESALQAADGAVRAARLAAVKLRAQVLPLQSIAHHAHRPSAKKRRIALLTRLSSCRRRHDAWNLRWIGPPILLAMAVNYASCDPRCLCPEVACPSSLPSPIPCLCVCARHLQDAEVSPADLFGLASTQLATWRDAHRNTEDFEVLL